MFENHTKSKFKQGYDPSWKEQATIDILETAKDAIISGLKKNTVAKHLCEETGMKFVYAQALAAKAWREVMATGKDRTEGMREKNIQRLEFLYARCVDQNDMKNALSALDQLSKLCMLYKEKIEVTGEEYVLDLIGEGQTNSQ